ncbi:MAG TPA: protein-disulfide reductase DsbD domain-containing protein [Bryobacteraceae bacterium]|nr:protein-disulfide reductase DsbD domain-containing protein [Bryobacteraceae bacterium]
MRFFASSARAATLLISLLCIPGWAQLNSLSSVLSVIPPERLVANRNQTITAEFRIQLREGYHVNSDKPADPYLIPLRFTFLPGPAQLVELRFPSPRMEKFDFSAKQVSVFDGEFKAIGKFRIAADAPTGLTKLAGKLRYQACSTKECLRPRTLDVTVPLEIR